VFFPYLPNTLKGTTHPGSEGYLDRSTVKYWGFWGPRSDLSLSMRGRSIRSAWRLGDRRSLQPPDPGPGVSASPASTERPLRKESLGLEGIGLVGFERIW
jgi:hypothetical protein